MRTTLTLDDDVARLLDDAVHRERRPLKQVVNDALRRALTPEPAVRPYRVRPFHTGLVPGVDPRRLNQLADEMEDDAIVGSLARDSR